MKKSLLTLSAVIAAMMFVTGCSGLNELSSAVNEATSADEVSTFGLKITKNVTTQAEIFKAIGAPSDIFNNEDGTVSWSYNRVAVRRTKLGFQTAANFAALFPYAPNVRSYGGGLAGVGASGNVKTDKSSYKTAALMINFNTEGCVSSYEFMATSY